MKKKTINLQNLANRIYDKENITSNAKEVSIALRINSLLFTDFVNVWEFDSEGHCFYKVDLQAEIQDLFKAIPISHTFKNEVMDFLPYLEQHQVQDYGKSENFEYEKVLHNEKMRLAYDKYIENESYVNRRIFYNAIFKEELEKMYELE